MKVKNKSHHDISVLAVLMLQMGGVKESALIAIGLSYCQLVLPGFEKVMGL